MKFPLSQSVLFVLYETKFIFGLLVGQNKQYQNISLASKKLLKLHQ